MSKLLDNIVLGSSSLVESDVPSPLSAWLFAEGSITNMAVACCRSVSLQLLQNQWRDISSQERHYYGLGLDETVFVREILMHCDDEPWWYARTVIPNSTYAVKQSDFDALGGQNIGSLLFNDNDIRRVSLDVNYEVEPHPIRFWGNHVTFIPGQACWIRYSRYQIKQSLLFMHEVFLPAMVRRLC